MGLGKGGSSLGKVEDNNPDFECPISMCFMPDSF